jgi:hypothetical protein
MEQKKQDEQKHDEIEEREIAERPIVNEPQTKGLGMKIRSRVKSGTIVWGD